MFLRCIFISTIKFFNFLERNIAILVLRLSRRVFGSLHSLRINDLKTEFKLLPGEFLHFDLHCLFAFFLLYRFTAQSTASPRHLKHAASSKIWLLCLAVSVAKVDVSASAAVLEFCFLLITACIPAGFFFLISDEMPLLLASLEDSTLARDSKKLPASPLSSSASSSASEIPAAICSSL